MPCLLSTGSRMLNVCLLELLAGGRRLVITGILGAILKTLLLPRATLWMFLEGGGVAAGVVEAGT